MIAIPDNADQTAAYQTTKDNGDGSTTYIIDLAKIKADKGYVHLHAIKGANYTKVTVKSMKLKGGSGNGGQNTPSKPVDDDPTGKEMANPIDAEHGAVATGTALDGTNKCDFKPEGVKVGDKIAVFYEAAGDNPQIALRSVDVEAGGDMMCAPFGGLDYKDGYASVDAKKSYIVFEVTDEIDAAFKKSANWGGPYLSIQGKDIKITKAIIVEAPASGNPDSTPNPEPEKPKPSEGNKALHITQAKVDGFWMGQLLSAIELQPGEYTLTANVYTKSTLTLRTSFANLADGEDEGFDCVVTNFEGSDKAQSLTVDFNLTKVTSDFKLWFGNQDADFYIDDMVLVKKDDSKNLFAFSDFSGDNDIDKWRNQYNHVLSFEIADVQ